MKERRRVEVHMTEKQEKAWRWAAKQAKQTLPEFIRDTMECAWTPAGSKVGRPCG